MQIATSTIIGSNVSISDSAKIYDFVQLRDGVKIGDRVIVGRNSYLGTNVTVGHDCKIQNYALIYEPATLERGVFVGPGVVFTNDRFPRAVTPEFKQKKAGDWESVGVYVKEGASIGARAVCVAPITIGRWAMIAAGSVVTKDVADFALVVGAPARRVGWVGKKGINLVQNDKDSSIFVCPETNEKYSEISRDKLIEIESVRG